LFVFIFTQSTFPGAFFYQAADVGNQIPYGCKDTTFSPNFQIFPTFFSFVSEINVHAIIDAIVIV